MDIDSVILAAQRGGKTIRKYFGKALDIEVKTTASDFRTKADTDSEKAIIKIIADTFPTYNILSEESGLIDKKSEYTFVIDPLDGSNNFVLGIPNFSVSIGLLRGDTIILGVVHHPILNHTYYAQRGKGAFLHKKQLHVNNEQDIKKATISYTGGYVSSFEYHQRFQKKLHEYSIKRMLITWSPAVEFCLLASGKIEAIINNKNEWYDYAAGKIIAREAGALITNFRGKPETTDRNNQFIISNGTRIHQQLVKIV